MIEILLKIINNLMRHISNKVLKSYHCKRYEIYNYIYIYISIAFTLLTMTKSMTPFNT
ncbi:hypothetical protein Hanom_Chr16g01479831 [Helianthus anomalus]